MGENEERNERSEGTVRKSAKPSRIAYVPIAEEDLAPYEPPVKKKHKALKITGLTLAMILAVAGSAYAGISYYYSDKFFEGTTINGIDCSGKTAYEAEQEIAKTVENYSIEVDSRNQDSQTISGDQIGYSYVSDGSVLKLLKEQKPYEWVLGFFETRSYTAAENTTYDKQKLKEQVKALNCAQEENQVAPENAYVAYGDGQFEIVPETEGSELDLRQAYNALSEAVSDNETSVDFNSDPDVYVKAEVTSDDPDLQASLDACNNFTKASITYTFGDETVTLDGSTIKDWLNFDEKGQLIRDDASFQQHIADYVAQLAAAHDTVGTEREFQTTSGRTVSVYGSAYGWQIDQASEVAQLTQEIQSGTQTTRDPIYSMTANAHGYNDIGNTYIEVDLTAQHLWYYKDGKLAMESDIVSGYPSKSRNTPGGVYKLWYKEKGKTLRGSADGQSYASYVDYWNNVSTIGIGLHDASWQNGNFGGERYKSSTWGSHGCINMPLDKAKYVYEKIDMGTPVFMYW